MTCVRLKSSSNNFHLFKLADRINNLLVPNGLKEYAKGNPNTLNLFLRIDLA